MKDQDAYIEDLTSIISYQGDSVVSKTIVKKKSGTIIVKCENFY